MNEQEWAEIFGGPSDEERLAAFFNAKMAGRDPYKVEGMEQYFIASAREFYLNTEKGRAWLVKQLGFDLPAHKEALRRLARKDAVAARVLYPFLDDRQGRIYQLNRPSLDVHKFPNSAYFVSKYGVGNLRRAHTKLGSVRNDFTRRAYNAGASSTLVHWMQLLEFYDRSTQHCTYCGNWLSLLQSYRGKGNMYRRLTFDHKLALDNGGANSIENLTIACAQCNSAKGTKYLKDLQYPQRGWINTKEDQAGPNQLKRGGSPLPSGYEPPKLERDDSSYSGPTVNYAVFKRGDEKAHPELPLPDQRVHHWLFDIDTRQWVLTRGRP